MPIFNYILWFSVINYSITDSFLAVATRRQKAGVISLDNSMQ